MINLAVINKRDLIKYILKFTVFILIITIASKILLRKENEKLFSINLIDDKNVTGILDETIPGIKQLNTKEENKNFFDKINPLELALKMEFGAIDTTIQKKKQDLENQEQEEIASSIVEENNEKIEQAKTRFKYASSTK